MALLLRALDLDFIHLGLQLLQILGVDFGLVFGLVAEETYDFLFHFGVIA